MRNLPTQEAEGKHVTRFYRGWLNPTAVDVTVPDEHHLFNFDVVGEGVHFLVLDDYGDDWLPTTFRKRVFGMDYGDYTVAIDRTDGQVHLLSFIEDDDGAFAFFVHPWMDPSSSDGVEYRIPRPWVRRLDELKNKKRPFRTFGSPDALMSFIDQSVGYNQLTEEMVFAFDFDGDLLEVWGDSHRRVARWKITPPARRRKGS